MYVLAIKILRDLLHGFLLRKLDLYIQNIRSLLQNQNFFPSLFWYSFYANVKIEANEEFKENQVSNYHYISDAKMFYWIDAS